MGFHKAVKLELSAIPHILLWACASDKSHLSSIHPALHSKVATCSCAIGDVKILAAGSDAAVIPGSTAWLQAFFLDCDVLTTGAISTIVWHLHLLVLSA